jgi:hypothetical protein
MRNSLQARLEGAGAFVPGRELKGTLKALEVLITFLLHFILAALVPEIE